MRTPHTRDFAFQDFSEAERWKPFTMCLLAGCSSLPLSHPSPKAWWLFQSIPLQPREAGHGSLSSLIVPACRPALIPPCPKGQAVLSSSTPAIPAPGQGLFTSFPPPPPSFFFFERARIKTRSPSFPFCRLLWVESFLVGVGNSNNKKQALNFNAIYLSCRCGEQTGFQEETLTVANMIYTSHSLQLQFTTVKIQRKYIHILHL